MIEQLTSIAFLVVAGLGSILLLTALVGATIYDIREANHQRDKQLHPRAHRYRQRSLVTVIIPTDNHELVIEHCLTAVLASTCLKLEVLVVDNGSTDQTKVRVKSCIAQHPKRSIRLVAGRRSSEPTAAVQRAFQRYGKGQLVMVLDPTMVIDKQALQQAALRFNLDPQLDSILPHIRVSSSQQLAGLIQIYQNFLGYPLKKAGSVFGALGPHGSGAIYRRQAFQASTKQASSPAQRSYLAYDAIVSTPAVTSVQQLAEAYYHNQRNQLPAATAQPGLRSYAQRMAGLRWLLVAATGIVLVLTPLLVSYFVYLAFGLHEPTFLMLSVAVLSLLLITAVWSDEQLRPQQKLGYSLGVPLTYGLFYLLSLTHIAALLSSIDEHQRLPSEQTA